MAEFDSSNFFIDDRYKFMSEKYENYECKDGVCYLKSKKNEELKNELKNESESKFILPNENEEWVCYGSLWCPFCVKAKEYFESNNIDFTYYDVNELGGGTLVADKLNDLTNGYNKIPMIFNKGKFIGGYTDLVSHFKNNK